MGKCLRFLNALCLFLFLFKAAVTAHKQILHSPGYIFDNLANTNSGIGIFTRDEKITVFPQYAEHADRPECAGELFQ